MSKPTVCIVGAGAVGAFYGSRLPGAEVSVICRSNYSVVQKHGFKMKTHTFGEYSWTPHRTFASPREASTETWDYVVVTTKALPDVTDDTVLLEPLVTPGRTAIVLIQNGVGVEDPYTKKFPFNPVVSGVTIISAAQNSPGEVTQNRWTRISLGPHGTNEQAKRMTSQFVALLKEGGVEDAEEYDSQSLQLIRWHKLAINASMNPSSVLSNGAGNAEMVKDPELREHILGIMQEILTTAPKVLGRQFPSTLATAEQILKSTERNTSGKPSMLLDWQRKSPMELEVILGNPIRLARRQGIEMPRLQSVYALLKMAQTRSKL